jgi:hypothetical protein
MCSWENKGMKNTISIGLDIVEVGS